MRNLRIDSNNYRKHNDTNKRIVEKSIKELGVGRSIVIDNDDTVIAGNLTYETAQKLGIPIEIIETTGDKLIAIKRTDLKTTDKKRKELALIDNHSTDLSEFDYEIVTQDFELEDLKSWEFEEQHFELGWCNSNLYAPIFFLEIT